MSPKGTPLTDEQNAAIAWADPDEPTADLARRLQLSYIAVYHARQRNRALGGWCCPLALSRCTECDQPLLGPAVVQRRQVHAECLRTREARWRRNNPHRREQRAEYDRTWRRRHPDSIARTLVTWMAKAQQEQEETKARATNQRQPWTAEDDALILSQPDVPTREIALALGRSNAAVFLRRSRLRREAT